MKLFILFLFIFKYVECEPVDLKDIGKSVTDVAKGVIAKIPDVIPDAEEFFQTTKNVLVGYPFDLAFRAINSFCK